MMRYKVIIGLVLSIILSLNFTAEAQVYKYCVTNGNNTHNVFIEACLDYMRHHDENNNSVDPDDSDVLSGEKQLMLRKIRHTGRYLKITGRFSEISGPGIMIRSYPYF